jgi:hypothetical protein
MLEVLPSVRGRRVASRCKRVAGSGDRNDLDGTDLNSPQAGAVGVQQASDDNPGIAAADDLFDAFECLHREPKGHGWESHPARRPHPE